MSITRRNLFLTLASLLVATRFDHFGAIPDASLAVFLLGGMLMGGAGAFAGLFALAFATDLAAIEVEAWRGYCMTPAYWGLVPTYALLWLGGAWLARRPDPLVLGRLALACVVLLSLAFVVSNLSWWAFSHRLDMPIADFWKAVAGYYPPYVSAGLLYLGIAGLVARSLSGARRVTA
ncbi:MAG: hypothetical protein EBS23_02655 [Betaproteobacteria bacterium]|nr:hypothetical protein [Betaproteobacteria bacterium]